MLVSHFQSLRFLGEIINRNRNIIPIHRYYVYVNHIHVHKSHENIVLENSAIVPNTKTVIALSNIKPNIYVYRSPPRIQISNNTRALCMKSAVVCAVVYTNTSLESGKGKR